MDSCMKFSVTIMENLLLAIQMIFNLCLLQGWPVAFTGGICHRYLPVNTGMDNTPKSGVYRHL